MVKAGGNVPVDCPDLIANLVFAHFAEGHTPALESRMIFTGKQVVAESPGFYLDLPYLF